MKLSKDERHTAYIILLAEIESNGYCNSICHLSGDIFDIYPCLSGIKWTSCKHEIVVQTSDFYPELWAKRPFDGGYWWNPDDRGTQKRKEVLKQCIEETADF